MTLRGLVARAAWGRGGHALSSAENSLSPSRAASRREAVGEVPVPAPVGMGGAERRRRPRSSRRPGGLPAASPGAGCSLLLLALHSPATVPCRHHRPVSQG